MKPVFQTTFGDGKDSTEPGNCFSACIASILELPIEDVPNFCAENENWLDATNRWLCRRDLFYLDVKFTDEQFGVYSTWFGHYVVSGPGPRGLQHSVVGWSGYFPVHDPHPESSGLKTKQLCYLEFGFICGRFDTVTDVLGRKRA